MNTKHMLSLLHRSKLQRNGRLWLRCISLGISFVLLLSFIFLAWWCGIQGPETVFRILVHGPSDIDDYLENPGRRLTASRVPFLFQTSKSQSILPTTVLNETGAWVSLDQLLQSNGTVAFLIIKDDAILYERYFQGYSEAKPVQVYSITKSIFSILVGAAVEDEYFISVDQPITDFVPELSANGFDSVTIRHLLQMTSGSNYAEMGYVELNFLGSTSKLISNESNPFGMHVRFGSTPHLEKEILKLHILNPPGTVFDYKSGDSAILSLALRRALKGETITEYMQRRLWEPLGMEHAGVFSIDHAGDGLEKVWCCLAITPRDLAKFGVLYLHQGAWNGVQVVPEHWVEQSTLPGEGIDWRTEMPSMGYQWWLPPTKRGAYLAFGSKGQFLYIDPAANMVIVRLGKYGEDSKYWTDLFTFIANKTR